jgi:hypothetical protein
MNWEAVSAIAEVTGVIGVIISLVYVGLQVKQNTLATEISTSQAYVNADNEIIGIINTSPDLADILHQGVNGISKLTGGDLIRYMSFHELVFISFQSFYLQWKNGFLSDALWGTYRQAFVDLLQQKGAQEWWEMRRHWFSDDFKQYVEESVDTQKGKPMHHGAMEQ